VRGALTEIVAVALHLAMMLALILSGADLALVIALSGSMSLFSGVLSAVVVRRSALPPRLVRHSITRERAMAIVPTAGWLLVVELSNLVMYASGRVVLGAYRSPAAVGQFEGPVRAHNLLYALGGALAVPVVPTTSRYAAAGDLERLRALAVRGTRYTLALVVPLCVTLMTLAEPILDVWLGDRYGGGGAALAILVSYWLLYGGLVVTPGFLVGAGRAPQVGRVFVGAAVLNLALALVLTPELGLEGPALATAIPFVLAFPVLVRVGLEASGARLEELARRAWLPVYSLGVLLAAGLLAARVTLEPDTLPAVAGLAAGGVLAYWAAFYALVLDRAERRLLSRRT
jgi:O-antigen/teichoic acid export membrane protein